MHVLVHCSERHLSPTEGAFEEGILARRKETTQKWITSLLDASCRRPTATTQSFPLRRGREHCAEAEVGATGWWCAVAEPGLSRTPGQVLNIDVQKLTVQKIHENINGKIDNITSRKQVKGPPQRYRNEDEPVPMLA